MKKKKQMTCVVRKIRKKLHQHPKLTHIDIEEFNRMNERYDSCLIEKEERNWKKNWVKM